MSNERKKDFQVPDESEDSPESNIMADESETEDVRKKKASSKSAAASGSTKRKRDAMRRSPRSRVQVSAPEDTDTGGNNGNGTSETSGNNGNGTTDTGANGTEESTSSPEDTDTGGNNGNGTTDSSGNNGNVATDTSGNNGNGANGSEEITSSPAVSSPTSSASSARGTKSGPPPPPPMASVSTRSHHASHAHQQQLEPLDDAPRPRRSSPARQQQAQLQQAGQAQSSPQLSGLSHLSQASMPPMQVRRDAQQLPLLQQLEGLVQQPLAGLPPYASQAALPPSLSTALIEQLLSRSIAQNVPGLAQAASSSQPFADQANHQQQSHLLPSRPMSSPAEAYLLQQLSALQNSSTPMHAAPQDQMSLLLRSVIDRLLANNQIQQALTLLQGMAAAPVASARPPTNQSDLLRQSLSANPGILSQQQQQAVMAGNTIINSASSQLLELLLRSRNVASGPAINSSTNQVALSAAGASTQPNPGPHATQNATSNPVSLHGSTAPRAPQHATSNSIAALHAAASSSLGATASNAMETSAGAAAPSPIARGLRLSPNQTSEGRWMARYEELKTFQQTYGHCRVPHGFAENRQLSWWVMNQRAQYQLVRQGKDSWLTEERIALLNAIGFHWSPPDGKSSKKKKKK